jgi:crotonobetaine/carnitine-CoA ligase
MSEWLQRPLTEHALPQTLARAAVEYGDKTWVTTRTDTISFRDAESLSNRLAHGLTDLGIGKGDHVLILMPDCIDHLIAWCALSKVGAVDIPVNTAFMGELLRHVVNDSRARTIICDASYLDQLIAVADSTPNLSMVILLNSQHMKSLPALPKGLSLADFNDLITDNDAPLSLFATAADPMSIIYTSGTTGPSKGVLVSQGHAAQYSHTCQESKELSEGDVYYTSALPLFHVAGRWGGAYSCLQVGASIAVPEKFSVGSYWDDIEKFGATVVFLLGVMASLLYRQPYSSKEANTSLSRVAMVPLIPEYVDFARRFNVRISTSYGSTECGAPAIHPMGTSIPDRRTIGKIKTELYEFEILDEHDKPVLAGEAGEICVRPKKPWITMLGYWNQPEATATAWRNLWLHTGDVGMRDFAGNVLFVDRVKDRIRRRGENISSADIEAIIIQHPAILECAVFPVPSDLTEDEIMAALVLKPDQSIDGSDLHRFLQGRLPDFMVPRYIDFLPTLPKTTTGKIRKQELRQRAVTENTWDVVTTRLGTLVDKTRM